MQIQHLTFKYWSFSVPKNKGVSARMPAWILGDSSYRPVGMLVFYFCALLFLFLCNLITIRALIRLLTSCLENQDLPIAGGQPGILEFYLKLLSLPWSWVVVEGRGWVCIVMVQTRSLGPNSLAEWDSLTSDDCSLRERHTLTTRRNVSWNWLVVTVNARFPRC
jgi:hypothetical protein